ncbi:MAG TPA: FHA domain-containing protein [Candidatus Eremiobacteraeota bacterium]|nr:FHA domain-containing protein [Candidatus Eremiobacteraeota bacterium]
MPQSEGFFSRIYSALTGSESSSIKPIKEDIIYELKVLEGEDTNKTFVLGETPLSIGRKLPGDTRINDILITDTEETISTLQARIYWDPSKNTHVMDYVTGTTYPTFIDGIVLNRPTHLQNGNHIVIGKNTFLYRRKKPLSIEEDKQEMSHVEFIFPGKEISQEEGVMDEDGVTEYRTGYFLKIISGLEEGKEYSLDKFLIPIGKLTVAERKGWILLDSSSVSVEQATLKWMSKDRKFAIIHHKGAITPTIVNKIEVSHEAFRLLEEGDIIKMGQVRMILLNRNSGKLFPISVDEIEEDPEDVRQSEEIMSEVEIEEVEDDYNEEDEKEDEEDEKTVIKDFKEAHKFKVISGPDEGSEFILDKHTTGDKVIIGRKGTERKDIELSDETVGEYCGSLIFDQGWLCIKLDDEKGELLVNSLSVIKKGLEEGDIIQLGKTVLEYTFSGHPSLSKSPSLKVIEGLDTGKTFLLNKKLIRMGRKSKKTEVPREIELSGKDKSISRLHACIEKKDNKFYLINEKNENKTFLNGVQVIKPRPLMDGDKIKLGDEMVLLFKYTAPPVVEKV